MSGACRNYVHLGAPWELKKELRNLKRNQGIKGRIKETFTRIVPKVSSGVSGAVSELRKFLGFIGLRKFSKISPGT